MAKIAVPLGQMYVGLAPLIIAGCLNMVWCRSGVATWLNRPIDNGRVLKDRRRVFGQNKTWKGVAGMVVLAAATAVLWGLLVRWVSIEGLNPFYREHENTVAFNALVGALLGVAYAAFELPNSFIKRRLAIEPGLTANGAAKWLFVVLDQADSIVGCALVVALLCPVTVGFLLALVVVGALTHIVLNMLLFALRLRRSAF